MDVSTDQNVTSSDPVADGFVVLKASSGTAPNGKSPRQDTVHDDSHQPTVEIGDYVLVDLADQEDSNDKPFEHVGAQEDPVGELAEKAESTLPDGWEEKKDFNSDPCLLHHKTKTTSPTCPVQEEDRNRTAQEKHDIDETPLPKGWEQSLDPRDQRPYYIDHITRTTSWVRPVAGLQETFRPLPKGWERRRTRDGKDRLYYVNHNEKTTSWTPPDEILSVRSEAGSEEATRPLPKGWEKWKTMGDNSRWYYVNHNNRTTSWTIPEGGDGEHS
ncbi:MAG: hypothetical protein Q9186_004830 [Xanthomendoza sp. 1 TL-2023]